MRSFAHYTSHYSSTLSFKIQQTFCLSHFFTIFSLQLYIITLLPYSVFRGWPSSGCIFRHSFLLYKLMQLGSPNGIDDFESKSRSKFDRRLTSIRIPMNQLSRRYRFSIYIDIKSIYFRLNRTIFDINRPFSID